jgi:hopene-associated glycosyltransferase HpnB
VLALALLALFIWLGVVFAPWQPCRIRERIEAGDPGPHDLRGLTVLIPARDESEVIATTLRALMTQGCGHRVLVIDDQSADGTAEVVRALGEPAVEVISGSAPPPGWSGKLWALQQGFERVDTELVLLLDADIELRAGMIATLREKLSGEQLALVSVMAELRMQTLWERLLLPAFVYFFKLIYPFRLANSAGSAIAAAAGGCMLIRSEVLEEVGGFAAIKDAIIDDCSLAKTIKTHGHRIWIGLTHSAYSQRRYDRLAAIWDMVARSAFAQLRYSTLLLVACTVLFLVVFVIPVATLCVDAPAARTVAAAAVAVMLGSYVPILTFYGSSPAWAALLPLVALLYLAMTWTSGMRYWTGERSRWKGRHYARGDGHTP